MLPISLVVVTDCRDRDSLQRTVDSVKDIVTEVVIVYQGNDPEKEKFCSSLAHLCMRSTYKGNADPDRNWAYTLATQDWILALDDDEWVPKESIRFIARIILSPAEVVWFHFNNLVDGVSIKDILGDDPHPRMWRNKPNLIAWPPEAHAFPQINTPNQVFTKNQIVHERTFALLEERHKSRGAVVAPQARELESRFLAAVKNKLGK